MSSLGATGLSDWKETATDFLAGQNVHTHIQDNNLTLDRNTGSPDWTKVGNDSFPPGRSSTSMVFDSANGIHIMFGGMVSDGPRPDNSTWTYNRLLDRWVERFPVASPSHRMGHAMAFDSRDGVTVLFGGSGGLNDTWIYNLTRDVWTEKYPAVAPPFRQFHSMVYDPGSGLIVLFGGLASSAYTIGLGDTWVYDLTNNTWTNRTGTIGPSPRYGQSMCYDPSIGLIVLFGGAAAVNGEFYEDTWTYDTASNTWVERNPSIHPHSRAGAPMTADVTSGNLLLFGGDTYREWYNDSWSYNASNNTWTSRPFSTGPPIRSYSVMNYDLPTRSFILYGGAGDNNIRDDYWSYDPAQNLWSNLDGLASPEPRRGASVAYDTANRVGILFGGFTCYPTYHNDTWIYDTLANRWERKQPISSPLHRGYASMCYDKDDGVVVLFGGTGGIYELNDTWTYNVSSNTWTNCQPALSPSYSDGCGMAYDPNSHLVILFGGYWYNQFGNETWTYDMKGNLWTNRTKATAPPARGGFAMAYDEASRAIILFGGADDHGDKRYEDTWSFNTSTFSWSQRFPTSFPSARAVHEMAFDSAIGEVLLFGGAGPDYEWLEDTWAYNGTTDNWTKLTPVLSPEPRGSFGLFYDSYAEVAVLFGGWGDSGPKGDTWLYGFPGRFTSGNYTSAPKDTGGTVYFGNLQWESVTPAGTSIRLQLRTGTTQAEMEAKSFTGPDGTAGTFFTSSGQRIPSIHNGSRWIQYRADLITGDVLITPTLTSVTVDYNLLQSIAITSPMDGENWTDIQTISWNTSDPDNDTLLFDLYLINSTGGPAPLAKNLISQSWPWNTSGIADGHYKIQIIAHDDNPSIPLSINSTSGEFKVNHPAPNHPPRIISTPTTEAWVGKEYSYNLASIDEDGDIPIFSIVSAPSNLILDSSTGKLHWTPTTSDIGNHTITIQVSDGRGSIDRQSFTITVDDNPILPVVPPKCAITYPANGTKVNGTIQIKGTATNGSLPLSAIRIRIDNGTWTTAIGLEYWTFNIDTAKLAKGHHRIEARAFAANLSSDTASADFTVSNPAPGISVGNNPWCLPILVILVATGIASLVLFRKRIRPQG
jgi:N-acetylneuraminic acid mutarotase